MSAAKMWTTVTRPMASAPTYKVPSIVPVSVGTSYRVMDKHARVKITIYTTNTSHGLNHTNSTNSGEEKKTVLTSQSISTVLKILTNVTRTFLVAIRSAPTKPAPTFAAATPATDWMTTNTHA